MFVLCLGVVVAGLSDTFLGDAGALARAGRRPGSASLLVVALLATVLANLVNNLPATLLLVPLVAPLGVTAVLAALVGLGVGSGLTYTGSLANLLWRRTLARSGPPSARTFHAARRAGHAAGGGGRRRSCCGRGPRWSASAAAPAPALAHGVRAAVKAPEVRVPEASLSRRTVP